VFSYTVTCFYVVWDSTDQLLGPLNVRRGGLTKLQLQLPFVCKVEVLNESETRNPFDVPISCKRDFSWFGNFNTAVLLINFVLMRMLKSS
jgi:hypothetical protein